MKTVIIALSVVFMLTATACSSKSENNKEENDVSQKEMSQQPVENGEYLATHYDITGKNERSGSFDGRLMVSISGDQSVLYVYENGNRTKIDYKVLLEKPFEKGDSGIYKANDTKGRPVMIATDSTVNVLTFEKNESEIRIDFDKTPKSTGSAMEMLERITTQVEKNK